MKVTIELKQGRCMTIKKIIYDSTTTPTWCSRSAEMEMANKIIIILW